MKTVIKSLIELKMIFYFKLFRENESIRPAELKKKVLQGFSGGQDSMFLLISNLHTLKQQNFFMFLTFISHNSQPLNIYLEYHCNKLFTQLSLPTCTGIIFISKIAEVKLREFRYDLLIRQLHYYQCTNISLSHSQTDLIESKFIEFIQKSFFFFSVKRVRELKKNKSIEYWPIKKNKKVQKTKNLQQYVIFRYCRRNLWTSSKYLKFFQVKSFHYQCKNKSFFFTFFFINKNKKLNLLSTTQLKIFVYRPVSSFQRIQILNINKFFQFPNQNDPTNFSISLVHNWCRHLVLPLFRLTFGTNFDKNLYNQFSSIVNSPFQGFYFSNIIENLGFLNRTIYKSGDTLLINLKILTNQEAEYWDLFFFNLNSIYKINLSKKELKYFHTILKQQILFLIRVRFPQILIINDYLIIRYQK